MLSLEILLENPDVLSSWFTGSNFVSNENVRNTTESTKRKEKEGKNFFFNMWRTCEESYPSELKSLLLNDNVNKSSTLVPISPTLNNQSLICVGCRVKNTNIFVNSNYQIIVNKNHPIAKLIIKVYYEENLCIGTEQTLSSLRSKYWIPACRGIICSVITSCLYCKRDRSKPVPPFMSDIPEDTLCVDEKPFTNTGVDYLGPYCIVWIGLSDLPV